MVTVTDNWVEFKFFRPTANSVALAGDFNDWRVNELKMVRCEDGYWQARMKLPAGEFRFRYCADGEWYADYAAFGVEPGRFGMDSIVRVPTTPVVPLTLTKPAADQAASAAA
jgi:1,4-alpha-glucan branching enzyme